MVEPRFGDGGDGDGRQRQREQAHSFEPAVHGDRGAAGDEPREAEPQRRLGARARQDVAEQHRRADQGRAVDALDARVVGDLEMQARIARRVGAFVRDDDLNVAVAARAQRLAARIRQRRGPGREARPGPHQQLELAEHRGRRLVVFEPRAQTDREAVGDRRRDGADQRERARRARRERADVDAGRLHARFAAAVGVAQQLQHGVRFDHDAHAGRLRGAVVRDADRAAHVAARRDLRRPVERERVARFEEARRRAHRERALERARARRPLQRTGDRQRRAVDGGRDDVRVDRRLDPASRIDAREHERSRRVAFADRPAVDRARTGRVAQAFGQRQPHARVFRGARPVVLGDQADANAPARFDLARRIDDEPGRFGIEPARAAHGELRARELELRRFRRRDGAAEHDARVVVERRVDARAVFDDERRAGRERGRRDRRVAEPERVAAAFVDRDLAAVDPRAAVDVRRAVGDGQHHDDVVRRRMAAVAHASGRDDLFAGLGDADGFERRDGVGVFQLRRAAGDQPHDVRADDVRLVARERRLQIQRRAVLDGRRHDVGERDAPLDARRDLPDVGSVGAEQARLAADVVERAIVDARAAGDVTQAVREVETHAQPRRRGAAEVVERERCAHGRSRFDRSVGRNDERS